MHPCGGIPSTSNRARTHWRDYISHQPWEHLRIRQEGLEDKEGEGEGCLCYFDYCAATETWTCTNVEKTASSRKMDGRHNMSVRQLLCLKDKTSEETGQKMLSRDKKNSGFVVNGLKHLNMHSVCELRVAADL